MPWDAGTPGVGQRTGSKGSEAQHAGSHGGANSGSMSVAAQAGANPEARGGTGATVDAHEVVINLALEEVRRSGEMGGLTYRRAPHVRMSAALA